MSRSGTENVSGFICGLKGFESGELRLGARSRRGFGKIAIDHARVKVFDMRKSDSYKEWLDWDWEQADAFEGAGSETIRIEDLEQAAEPGGNIVWRFCSVFPVRCWSALMPWPLQGQRIFRIMGR